MIDYIVLLYHPHLSWPHTVYILSLPLLIQYDLESLKDCNLCVLLFGNTNPNSGPGICSALNGSLLW